MIFLFRPNLYIWIVNDESQRQKIINDFGEKIDMKSNWIETAE